MSNQWQKPLTIFDLRRGVAASRATARRLGLCAGVGGVVAAIGFATIPTAHTPIAVPSILAAVAASVACVAMRYMLPVIVVRRTGWDALFAAMQRAEARHHEHAG